MRGDELKEECVKDWYTKCKFEKEQLLPTASGDATSRLFLELSPGVWNMHIARSSSTQAVRVPLWASDSQSGRKTLSCLKLQIVLSIHSDLICILSSEWVKGQRKKSAILTITEECAKFSWMVISILLLYSALTVFSNQLLSISDSAGIDLIV